MEIKVLFLVGKQKCGIDLSVSLMMHSIHFKFTNRNIGITNILQRKNPLTYPRSFSHPAGAYTTGLQWCSEYSGIQRNIKNTKI